MREQHDMRRPVGQRRRVNSEGRLWTVRERRRWVGDVPDYSGRQERTLRTLITRMRVVLPQMRRAGEVDHPWMTRRDHSLRICTIYACCCTMMETPQVRKRREIHVWRYL